MSSTSTPKDSALCPQGLLLGLLLSSCVTANTDVEAEDRLGLFADGRVTWVFAEETERGVAGNELEPGGMYGALDVHVSNGTANDQQLLTSGQIVILGGQRFDGPQPLFIDYEINQFLVDARYHTRSLHGLAFEVFAGIEYCSIDLDVRQEDVPSAKLSRFHTTSLGPALGAALVWQPIKTLKFYAESKTSYGYSSDSQEVESTSVEVGFSSFPDQSLSLFGGWRQARIEASPENFFSSGLDLRLSGPVIGLWVRF